MRPAGPPLIVGAAFLAAGLALAANTFWLRSQPVPAVALRQARAPIGQPVPAFELPDLGGRPVRLPPPGRPVLLNYWASWCGPCLREMPLLADYERRRAPGQPGVVAVAQDAPADVAEYLARQPVPFQVLVEAPGPANSSARLGNRPGLLPYTVLIDARGRLQAVKAGPFADRAELEAWASVAR